MRSKEEEKERKMSGKKLVYRRLAQRNHRVHTCVLYHSTTFYNMCSLSFYYILRSMDNFALFCDEILQEIDNLPVENIRVYVF